MKLQISYGYTIQNKGLKNSLLYFLPNKENEIDLIIQQLLGGNILLINENSIKRTSEFDFSIKCLSTKDFINAVNLLKQCDENTIIFQLHNDVDDTYFKLLNCCIHQSIYGINKKELKYIMIGNDVFDMYDNIYTALFKEFKLVDIKTYIRYKKILKINQLL